MFIKSYLSQLVEKITGRKCTRCRHNCAGRCCHPDGRMFMRCWDSITRPGFEYSEAVHYARVFSAAFSEGLKDALAAPGDMTEEEKYQLGKIVESLQEASATAQDAGLLEDEMDGDWFEG